MSYILVFILDQLIYKHTILERFGGKSFNNMEPKEWYRLLTGSFFHENMLHLAGNVCAMYFVGIMLEHKIGSPAFLVIYLIGNVITYAIYSKFANYTQGTGASPGIYALIACIIMLHFDNQAFLTLHFDNWAVNYVFAYLIIGNFYGMGAFIVHIIGFSLGLMTTFILLF